MLAATCPSLFQFSNPGFQLRHLDDPYLQIKKRSDAARNLRGNLPGIDVFDQTRALLQHSFGTLQIPRGSEPGSWRSRHSGVFDDEILQVPAGGQKAGFPRKPRQRIMNRIRRKGRPTRLDPLSYENLRQQVLPRDGWRCQSCGAMSNLEIHHQEFRSHAGEDSQQNLITICTGCHSAIHRGH